MPYDWYKDSHFFTFAGGASCRKTRHSCSRLLTRVVNTTIVGDAVCCQDYGRTVSLLRNWTHTYDDKPHYPISQ